MPDIVGIVGILQKLENRNKSVHQNRCVRVRNKNTSCHRCADACAGGAITFEENAMDVDISRCIGCGTCVTVCPTGALEAKAPTDDELLATCVSALECTGGEVVIACNDILKAAAGKFDSEKVVGVECLGRIDESLLSALVAHGAQAIRLVQAKCDDCPHISGYETAVAVCETENTLLTVWNQSVQVKLSAKFPASVRLQGPEAYDHDKRAFLDNVRTGSKETAVMVADETVKGKLGEKPVEEPRLVKVGANGALPQTIPSRRVRLVDALKGFGMPEDELIETRLWGHVIIDTDLCNSCRMCATFCPTGAIWKVEQEGFFGVEHFPGNCVKCRCCEDVCRTKALTLSDEVFVRDVVDGRTERYRMKSPSAKPGSADYIAKTMQNLLGGKEIYLR